MTEPTTQTVSETAFKSDFLRLMKARGYIHQITHPVELDEAAAAGVVTGYIGFDATAPSLHVGHLIQIMLLRRLQQAGHKPIVLMGGGTTKVGDPSFKDTQRPLLTEEKIAENIAGIKGVFEKFLTFGDGPTDAVMLDNDEWLSQLGYLQFLRDYGTHFTINRMLSFDSVKLRLDREQPLTFLEFNYMLMQATDFLELNRRYGCSLQMGGSDQWGNIINGVELTRKVDHKAAFGKCIDEQQVPQHPQVLSFIGGYPRIPITEDFPKCQLCGAEQSFFFQVAFPKNHVWKDLSIAIFACTSCDDEKYCIPEMLPSGNPSIGLDQGGLYGVNIPKNFLRSYQRNFRILIFPTDQGELRTEYVPKVAYKKLKLSAQGCKEAIGIVGGKPRWIQGDETPASYDGHVPMKFLMQINEYLQFDILPGAPSQMEYDFFTDEIKPSKMRYYELFLGNSIYFFGTEPPYEPLVYVFTQID